MRRQSTRLVSGEGQNRRPARRFACDSTGVSVDTSSRDENTLVCLKAGDRETRARLSLVAPSRPRGHEATEPWITSPHMDQRTELPQRKDTPLTGTQNVKRYAYVWRRRIAGDGERAARAAEHPRADDGHAQQIEMGGFTASKQ